MLLLLSRCPIDMGPKYSYDRRVAAFPREFYLPPEARGTKPLTPEGTDLAIWLWEGTGRDGREKPYGIAFAGKANKPLWHYSFRSESERARTVEETIKSRRRTVEYKQKQQEERRNFEHNMKVGDILYSSWGYDQTNVNFYEIVDLRGKDIILREIAKKTSRESRGADYVVPIPGKYVGSPIKRRPTGRGVKIDTVSRAYPWDGKPKYETATGWGH